MEQSSPYQLKKKKNRNQMLVLQGEDQTGLGLSAKQFLSMSENAHTSRACRSV